MTRELLVEFGREVRSKGQELVIVLRPSEWPTGFVTAIRKETKILDLTPGFQEQDSVLLNYPICWVSAVLDSSGPERLG